LEVQVHHLISLGGWNDVIHLSIRRTWREALSCLVWIDSHIYMNRLGLISR
jgi:hypothetical protein